MYNFCFKLSGTISQVKLFLKESSEINDVNASNFVHVLSFVSEVIECINSVDSSNINDYGAIRELMEEFYDVIYMLIKEEIMLNDRSNLFNFIMVRFDYKVNIASRVIKEIKDKGLDKIDDIRAKCFSIDKSGLSSDYFDFGLIKGIVYVINKDLLVDKYSVKLGELRDKYEEGNERVLGSYRSIKSQSDDLGYYINNIKKYSKSIFKRGISFVLSTATFVTLGGSVIPKLCIYDAYKTTTTTYTVDGIVSDPVEGYEKELESNPSIVLKDCSPWEDVSNKTRYHNYGRDVYIYASDNLRLVDIDKYFDMDFSGFEEVVKPDVEYKDNLSLSDYYDEVRREIVVIEQNMTDVKSINDEYRYLWLALLLVMELVLEISCMVCNCPISIISSFVCFINDLKELINSKRDYKEGLKEYKYEEVYFKFISLIKENDEVKSKFDKVYNEFVIRYGEHDEIKKIYDEVNNSFVKDIDSSGLIKVKKRN